MAYCEPVWLTLGFMMVNSACTNRQSVLSATSAALLNQLVFVNQFVQPPGFNIPLNKQHTNFAAMSACIGMPQ